MIYLPRTNHPIPYRPDYYNEQAEYDNSYDYFMALMAYALLDATKNMCEYTKQELIEAMCFEYGVRYFNADILHSTEANIIYLERNIAWYENLRDNAPSEGNRNHYTRMVIQTRRRLLLWHMVKDYLESEATS